MGLSRKVVHGGLMLVGIISEFRRVTSGMFSGRGERSRVFGKSEVLINQFRYFLKNNSIIIPQKILTLCNHYS